MKISHERLRSDISADNTFIAREDDGTPVGACTVQPRRMGLFPDMPRQYVIEAEGDDRALHVLYGAAVVVVLIYASDGLAGLARKFRFRTFKPGGSTA